MICLDTSILIDFYRKKVKEKSHFFQLTKIYKIFAVSVVTEYEIMIGADPIQSAYWAGFFERVTILPFDKTANDVAIAVTKILKERNKLIEIPDIFIGATAVSRKMKIATLNKKHFERIPGLTIIS
ncbi:MAG: type II toxin-antitoxin system VapC family toxin [Pedobacter sp.]|nr:type II toxin-antitoxin system VapC family toxin [Pedobacter sp.]